jgi:hypothetical protein
MSALYAAMLAAAVLGPAGAQATSPPDLSDRRLFMAADRSAPPAASPLGPRRDMDHRFLSGGLLGQAGFLCGRQPASDHEGAAAAHGYDPKGRFLGAKLSLVF